MSDDSKKETSKEMDAYWTHVIRRANQAPAATHRSFPPALFNIKQNEYILCLEASKGHVSPSKFREFLKSLIFKVHLLLSSSMSHV